MGMAFSYLQVFGAALIMLGLILFILPVLMERLPSLEDIPWILVYFYRSGNFTFVTSPILIIISVLSLLLYLLSSGRA